MPGMPSDRYAKGYKAGSSSDPTRPLDGSELIFVELTTEEDPHERVRVALTADIVNDLGFATTDVNETLVLSKADGGQVALKIENGLIVSVRHGAGTEADPYQVWTPTDLDMVREALDAWYVQMDDIDLAAYANWEPIGTEAAAFTGVYDGAGFKITNLVCETANAALPYHAGLFGFGSGCTLSSLIIEDADVKSEADDAAILIGRVTGVSVITGCIVSGLASGASCGGLVGTANTTVITDCGANVTVTGIGAGKIGGLVAVGGVISDCYALGDVQGTCSVAGGLVGSTGLGHSVTNSYAMGNVTATASGACGGLAGESLSNITKCYSIGAVSGGAANNGLIGNKQNPLITPVADTCLWLQDATLDPTVNVGLATPNFSSNGELQSTMMEADTYGAGGLNWGAEWVFDDGVDYPRLAWESA